MSLFCYKKRRTLQCLSILSLSSFLPLGLLSSRAHAASAAHAGPKVALVVGNSRYPDLPLQNPANDAVGIADKLKKMGFVVDLQIDCKKAALENAIRLLTERVAKQNAVGLFYFAGHGLQIDWRNYLVPVDAMLSKAGSHEIPQRTVDMRILLDGLNKAKNPINIIILDACRNNPFGGNQKTGNGLSQMDAPMGTLLAYATAPGNVASDGAGSNGLYTENLLREMQVPEAKIEDVFKRVRLNVRLASNGKQIPWESTSLEEDFYFIPPEQLKKISQEERDRLFAEESKVWEQAKEATTAAPLEDYLRRYPSGHFCELAQLRLDRLLAKQGERKVVIPKVSQNPYSKGTEILDINFRPGDRFVYKKQDMSTKIESTLEDLVTEVTEREVRFSNGAVSDLLGNWIVNREGLRFTNCQWYPAEYSLGRRWVSRHRWQDANGLKGTTQLSFVVVKRETITVPAGTFDAFRVEGKGWILEYGAPQHFVYWIAPDIVPRYLAFVITTKGQYYSRERYELVSYSRR